MPLAISLSPTEGTEISPSAVITADVLGGDTWIAARYDDGAAEIVHDGTDFMPRFAYSVLSVITGGLRYAVQRIGGWPGKLLTLKYYDVVTGSESSSESTMGAPIVDKDSNINSSGDEVVAVQLPFDTNLCNVSTCTAKLAILGGSSSGTATFRAYIGGAQASANSAYTGGGTLVGTKTTASALDLLRLTGTPIANPTGVVYLTLTYQSSAPGADVTKAGVTGVVQ